MRSIDGTDWRHCFTYEDSVVTYYLAVLLREELAAPLDGVVKSVAVQQAENGNPMDDKAYWNERPDIHVLILTP